MKKLKKVLFLIILLMMVLALTTSSKAYYYPYFMTKDDASDDFEVSESTTGEEMLNALIEGKHLKFTQNGAYIRDRNNALICRQPTMAIYKTAEYILDKNDEQTVDDIKKIYPYDSDNDGIIDDGYAEAYILTALLHDNIKSDQNINSITSNDEGQYAWYIINNFSGWGSVTPNDLLETAKAYEAYKKIENTFCPISAEINGNEYKLSENENEPIEIDGLQIQTNQGTAVGPINIYYYYGSFVKNGKVKDEWGGFDYTFYDENGNEVSDKVSLCTLLDTGEYKSISDNDDYVDGYYKVRSLDYASNNTAIKNLYIVTQEDISNIKISIKQNKVDYEAATYPITGEFYNTTAGYCMCTSCENKVKSCYKWGGRYYTWYNTTYSQIPKFVEVGPDGDRQEIPVRKWGILYLNLPGIGKVEIGKSGSREFDEIRHCRLFNDFCGAYLGQKTSPCGTWVNANQYTGSQDLHLIVGENKKETNYNLDLTFSPSINVEKKWEDENNKYGNRPEKITVELLANGVSTGKTLELNSNNNWEGKFKEFDMVDSSGNKINYSIKEISPPTGYITINPTKDSKYKFVITNTLERTEVPVEKIWEDNNDKKGIRPDTITIVLYRNGTKVDEVTLSGEGNSWKHTFTNLPKYVNNELAIYTIEEVGIPDGYVSQKTGDATNGFIVTNSFYEGYIEIIGKVWVDGAAGKGNDINGIFGQEDSPLKGIKVTLKDEKGNQFDPTSVAYTDENGNYIIKVNYDNSQNVYKLYEDSKTVEDKLNTAYVEFEYDGLKYTTVKDSNTGVNTSKAIEDENARNTFDEAHSKVTSSTPVPGQWINKNITAKTKDVISFGEYIKSEENMEIIERDEIIKYCNGNGTYTFTNKSGAWKDVQVENHTCSKCNKTGHTMETFGVDVEIIKNINLGLFEREQPDVAIFTDLTKVEVTMNSQQYTYLYGIMSNKYQNSDLQTKFQNNDTYTYKRPVNPADIAYIQTNPDELKVLVTYEVKVANLSTTLPVTINSIINVYDTEYEIHSLTKGGTPINYKETSNYGQLNEFKEITLNNLNMTILPLKEASGNDVITIVYNVKINTIKEKLLQGEATLNNAVEINEYSIKYGEKTLYAEQRISERTGKPYGGYDYNSHPGNAGIFINNEGRLEVAKSEDDTDIAPSFALIKSEKALKTISGTVWEDTDITENAERLGNGKYDDNEKKVENVKVELYNLDGTPAKLYNETTKELDRDAIVYTNENGEYSLDGVTTGEYYIKYTYGDEKEKLYPGKTEEELKQLKATTMDRGTTTVNARNNKSTIITDPIIKNILSKDYVGFTEEEKMWHITHEDGYSVAVDNMKERLQIEDLQYDNFEKPLNMTAYTKPFKTLVEFEKTGKSDVKDDTGEIEGVSNVWNKMDFGIIERPREDLFVQKTITYVNLELANGQAITEGNPNTDKLNYAKAMGFENITSGEEARKALDKQLLIELDSELIQGATLKIDYQVKVTNNNEIDYDYGALEDYTDIVDNQYITKSAKANYYYYGDHTNLNEMKSTIEFVDYIDNELVYKADTTKWVDAKADELYNAGLINKKAKDLVKNQSYQIFRSASGTSITLARGETFEQDMTASRILANKDKTNYDNNVEIIKIDGKTARTIQESKEGIQVEKTYKPGNYVPNLESGTYEQDDDRVIVLVTSSTGITNYVTPYIIAGLIGLVAIVAAVIFIKKKVLIK